MFIALQEKPWIDVIQGLGPVNQSIEGIENGIVM